MAPNVCEVLVEYGDWLSQTCRRYLVQWEGCTVRVGGGARGDKNANAETPRDQRAEVARFAMFWPPRHRKCEQLPVCCGLGVATAGARASTFDSSMNVIAVIGLHKIVLQVVQALPCLRSKGLST